MLTRAEVAAATCAALVSAVMSAAQTPSSQKPASPRAEEQRTVTIVGCLVQGNPAGAGVDRTAGSVAGTDFFVRTPAIEVPVGTTVTVGKPGAQAGTTTSTSAGEPDKTAVYRITGLNESDLRPHVGHRVEFRGHLANAAPGTSTNATTTVDATGRATTTVETRLDVAGVLHATAMKMVSASCQ